MKKSLILAAGSIAALISAGKADQVIADDQIVQGSLAAGIDGVNNEVFGFDTVRLKENNTRLGFNDTSVSPFASNDWTLEANSNLSGGANYLGFRDKGATGGDSGSESGTMSFRIEAGAAEGSLWVNSSSRVGMGTTNPATKLHLAEGNTPTMRLEQNANSGFTAQTWDVAGNETNFFVRDLTNGSKLPFRIRPGAPTSSIDINGSGDVGVGTSSPNASLHVLRTDGTTALKVEDASATTLTRNLLRLRNNGGSSIKIVNTAELADAGGGGWQITSKNGMTFAIRPNILSAPSTPDFLLEYGGKLTLLGSANATAFNTTSDKNLKKDITSVEPRDILKKVNELPIGEWSFISGDDNVRHIGPMAQDFKQQFGLGPSDKTINVMDSAGVALAAIQGLQEILNEREAEINDLSVQMKELRAELESLKKASSDEAP